MSKGKMNGIMVNGSLTTAGLTFYTRNGKTIVRTAHSNQPRRRSRAQFDVRQRMRHTMELWREMRHTGACFYNGKNNYGGFATLAYQLPVVYMPSRGALATASFLMPGIPVSFGTLAPIDQHLGEVDGIPALLTDLQAGELRRSERLRLFTMRQVVEGDTPRMRASVREVPASEFSMVDGRMALVDSQFADDMAGWALVRVDYANGIDGGERCSTQSVLTNCKYYEQYTTAEALAAAAESYGGLTE